MDKDFNATEVWDEARLQKMIHDRIEEGPNLDYKAAGALTREPRGMTQITKDVSAMANSDGGHIIYGIAEFQLDSKKHLPERIVPVNRDDFSREWLEHIISQIRPRIQNLKIHPIQLTSDSTHVAYVVEVPQGHTAHQANDQRYYRRYNFECLPMPDHEVRDVMNRKTHPRVTVILVFTAYQGFSKDENGVLTVIIKNDSNVFARYVKFVVHSPIRIQGKLITYEDASLQDGDHGCGWILGYSNHLNAPLFPRSSLIQQFKFKYVMSMQPEPDKQLDHFRWMIFADSMPMQHGICKLEDIITTDADEKQ